MSNIDLEALYKYIRDDDWYERQYNINHSDWFHMIHHCIIKELSYG
jgi:hypothetical protein